MATLAEVLADVFIIVPQPDKEALIRNKINAVINLISKSGYFWRDIEETTIDATDGVSITELVQSIPITTAQRHFYYVQSTNTDEQPIALIEPEMVVKANCAQIVPIAYATGSYLHIKHEQLTDEFNLGYYTSPTRFATDESDDAETNWILESCPELVVDLAAAYVLTIIGEKDDAKRIIDLSTVFRGTYIKDFVASRTNG